MADIYIDPSAITNGSGVSPADPFDGPGGAVELATWNNDRNGDTAHLRAGTTYRGLFNTTTGASNFSFIPYGDGDKPIIKASTLEAFTLEGNDIWFTQNLATQVNSFLNGQLLTIVATKPELTIYTAWQNSATEPLYVKMGVGENPNGQIEVTTIQSALRLHSPLLVRDMQVYHGFDTSCILFECLNDVQMIAMDGFWGGGETPGVGRNNFEVKGVGGGGNIMATGVRVRDCTSIGAKNNDFEIWYLDGAVFSNNRSSGSFSNFYELWRWIQNSTFEKNTGIGDLASGDRRRMATLARMFGDESVAGTGNNSGNTFKNNVVNNSYIQPFHVNGDTGNTNDNNKFYFNTLKNCGFNSPDSNFASGLVVGTPVAGTEFKGNIVDSTKTARSVEIETLSTVFEGNIWNTPGDWLVNGVRDTNLTNWNSNAFVTNDLDEDPLLDSSYLPANTNVINAGAAGTGVIDDFYRSKRIGVPDIGAVEIDITPKVKISVSTD